VGRGKLERREFVEPGMSELTVYSTSWCGYCRRLKLQLNEAGIAYREIDIDRDPGAAAFVEQSNGGYQTVPTVVFPDGRVASNPSFREVRAALAA
jgi:mycoredoxin